jgi:hypothetical protein
MPELAVNEVAKDLRAATLGYLWRQWRAVGATVSSGSQARIIVDPEVLILMSLWMLEHERRLADVVWSWVGINSSLLSIQRLGNLRESFPPEVSHRLSAVAENRLTEAKDPRWKSLKLDRTESLGARSAKTRAIQPRLNSWATLIIQLRLGLGVGVKADALAFVLGLNPAGSEWASVAMIADALGYTPTAVRRAADDLARARFIRSLETAESESAAQRMFSSQAADWATLLHLSVNQPGWGFWRERYLFVIDVLTWLDREESKRTGDYARDVQAREILSRHGLALRKDRIVDPIEFAAAELNVSYLLTACRAYVDWLSNQG